VRFVLIGAIAACNGRVEEPRDAIVDAPSETFPHAGCFIGSPVEPCGDAPTVHPYRRVDIDWTRRCLLPRTETIEMCACLKLATDCWIEQKSGAVFIANCTANLLPGYCKCSPELEAEIAGFAGCPEGG
jgi:hypothetical protein